MMGDTEFIDIPTPPWPTCPKCGDKLGLIMVERPGPLQCFTCDPPPETELQRELAGLRAALAALQKRVDAAEMEQIALEGNQGVLPLAGGE